MTNDLNPTILRRRRLLAGPGSTLLRRLAEDDRINLNTFISRDGYSACLLGHLAAMPALRADGWRFINGVPYWTGLMGVSAAAGYFGLEQRLALDLFGNCRESRTASLERRFMLMETIVHCSMSNDMKLAG